MCVHSYIEFSKSRVHRTRKKRTEEERMGRERLLTDTMLQPDKRKELQSSMTQTAIIATVQKPTVKARRENFECYHQKEMINVSYKNPK